MRMIDEDKVGLKEKPEDTRYINKIKTRSTGCAGKWLPLLGLRTLESKTIFAMEILAETY